jgi:hypothetical protein
VEVSLVLRVITQGTGTMCDQGIIRRQSSTFAISTQVLAGVKAKARDSSELANPFAAIPCSVRLCGVLDDRYTMLNSDRVDPVHFRRHTIKMHWNYSFCPGSNGGFEFSGRHGPTCTIDIDKNWRCTHIADCPGGRDETHGDGDYLIPLTNIEAAQRKIECA